MRASSFPWPLLLVCCSNPASPPQAPENASPQQKHEAPAVVPVEPVRPAAPVESTPPAAHARVRAPEHGCALELEQRLAPGTRGVALGARGTLVASEDALTLWQLADGFREGPRLKLDSPVAKASALCSERGCAVALVDQKMRLLYTELGASLPALRELARGVDRRFAPALAQQGERVLIAYTATVDEIMHTKLVGVRAGEVEPTQDVTPDGHGAAAPTFLLGASPTLVAIDAHAGISPLLELPLTAQGKPREVLVRTPVSQPFEPPQLAAVQWQSGAAEVFFTVVGKLAMTAIGRVPLRETASVSALSPSRGYGELSFAVARGPRRALFACEVPIAATPKAERKLELTLSDGQTSEDALTIDGPASQPSLARLQDGYALAFSRGDAVHAAVLRCAE